MKPLYIYFLAASLACTSCSDSWLDLNPSTSVPTDQAFTTLENAQTALNGIYRLASAHSYYGDNFFYFGDCRAADVQARMSKGDGKESLPITNTMSNRPTASTRVFRGTRCIR